MIQYTTTSSSRELEEILLLQQRNLPRSISDTEKEKEGFVTVHHSFEILQRMHDVAPHIIAKDDKKVVGYALCMAKDFKNDIPVLKPMFAMIDQVVGEQSNYIVMGQICIDKAYRRQGIFRGLYTKMKEVCSNYEMIITEIDLKNTRSIAAHKAVGFKTIHRYTSNNQDWEIVSLAI